MPSSPAAPSSGTPGTISIVGQALGSGKVWLGDSAGLAQEVALSGDATVSNTGVVSLVSAPATRTRLGLGVADSPTHAALTLTNTSNQIVLGTTRTLTLTAPTPAGSSRTLTLPDPGGNDSVVYLALAQTLTNKTLTTPTIASFVNAQHAHAAAASGGTVALSDTTGTLALARGGTGATDAATARTNLGVMDPVTGVPTGVPTEGVGTTRLATLTRAGGLILPMTYYYARSAHDAAINCWWRAEKGWYAGSCYAGALRASND